MRESRTAHAGVEFRGEIYIFGGMTERFRLLRSVEIYNPESDRWRQGPELPFGVHYHSAVVANDQIYLIGGLNENRIPSHRMLRYDPEMNRHHNCDRLPEPLYGMNAVFTGRFILIAGGRSSIPIAVADAYYFDVENEMWSRELPPRLTYPRSNFGMVFQETAYVIGGIDFGPISSIEALQNNRWEPISRIPAPRGFLSSAVLADSLIVVAGGGVDEEGRRSSRGVQGFNIHNRTWMNLPSMIHQRSDFAMVKIDNRLYAIGGLGSGRGENQFLNSAEYYEHTVNVDPLENPLPKSSSMKIFPNPSNGVVFIQNSISFQDLEIYTIRGDLILKIADKNLNVRTWDSSLFPAGVYLCKHTDRFNKSGYLNKIQIVK